MNGTLKRLTVAATITLLTLSASAGDGNPADGQQRLRKRDGSCAIQPGSASDSGWVCPRRACGRLGAGGIGWQGRQAPQKDATNAATVGAVQTTPATDDPSAAAAAPGPTTRPGMGFGMGRGMGRGMGGGRGMGPGAGAGPGTGAGRARGMGMGMGVPETMRLIHALLDNHLKVRRDVQEIPGGVLTTTTSKDVKVTEMIRSHVRQMKERMDQGQPLRMWDPLFAELFRQHAKVHTYVEDIAGGVNVTQTSDDPQVTLLIRQHAVRGVSEFAARGWDRVHEPTPLPAAPKPGVKGE